MMSVKRTFWPQQIFQSKSFPSISITIVEPKLKYPSSSPFLKLFPGRTMILPTFKAPTIIMLRQPPFQVPSTQSLAFFSQTFFLLMRVFQLTLQRAPQMAFVCSTANSVGVWNLWQSPGARQKITWQSLLLGFFLSCQSCWLVQVIFSPVTSSPKEQVAPLMIEHLSSVIQEILRTLLSAGQMIVAGSVGMGLGLTFRVKKALKVSNESRGSMISSSLTWYFFAQRVKNFFLRNFGILTSLTFSAVLDI